MQQLSFDASDGALKHILCLGAHCDDIEIGIGGTLLRLAEQYPQAQFHWVVFCGNEQREAETRACADRLLGSAGGLNVEVLRHRNGYFPYVGDRVKDDFERLKARLDPDLVFTHYQHDRHQDHRTVSDLTWNTFRDHLVLEYEIPKYDGDLGQPNVFVALTPEQRQAKVDAVMDCFASQAHRPWFSRSTFDALMRLRGMEANAPSGYAEGFYGRKCVL